MSIKNFYRKCGGARVSRSCVVRFFLTQDVVARHCARERAGASASLRAGESVPASQADLTIENWGARVSLAREILTRRARTSARRLTRYTPEHDDSERAGSAAAAAAVRAGRSARRRGAARRRSDNACYVRSRQAKHITLRYRTTAFLCALA